MKPGYRGFGARTAAQRDPHAGRKCRACQVRDAEEGGICSACREQGRVDSLDEQRRRAERRRIREAERDGGLVQRIEVPRQTYTREIDGVEYVVIWDGRVRT